ncbi:Hypothetical protein SMAX5B_000620 [Scophthalmus maximus]|uniref:Uncharacterized protein n=1 Tax=Scophthalmus maximus TaxID=52904 RepID=A0A2U9B5Y7_SCOMX|nr:Hypothetical protein SMAX5B_000620 [Scophthalmus maximus]
MRISLGPSRFIFRISESGSQRLRTQLDRRTTGESHESCDARVERREDGGDIEEPPCDGDSTMSERERIGQLRSNARSAAAAILAVYQSRFSPPGSDDEKSLTVNTNTGETVSISPSAGRWHQSLGSENA